MAPGEENPENNGEVKSNIAKSQNGCVIFGTNQEIVRLGPEPRL